MPITVSIKVNDREVSTLHIARISSGLDRDRLKVHTYSVLKQEEAPQRDAEWAKGALFTHRYGDPVEVCVQHALTALATSEASKSTADLLPPVTVFRNR